MVVFVACPYTNPNPEITEGNIVCLEQTLASLLVKYPHKTFINPLAMHHVAKYNQDIPTDYPFWQRHSRALIDVCDEFLLMDHIDGWDRSVGVRDEMEYFTQKHPGIKIKKYTEPLW